MVRERNVFWVVYNFSKLGNCDTAREITFCSKYASVSKRLHDLAPTNSAVCPQTLCPSTDMRRLTTGIRYEKRVVRRFRRCANVIKCILYSWFRASSLYVNKIQQDATDAGIYLLQNYSTCFGCLSHPSSGVQ